MIENGGETLLGETFEPRYPYYERPMSPGGDSMTSSLECDLMIESLQRELEIVRLELEAIVLQEIPRAPINTGGGGGEGTEERSRCNATDDTKLGLLQSGGAGRIEKLKPVSTTVRSGVPTTDRSLKSNSQISWEKQKYYINLVTEREKEISRIRKQYLTLMRERISNQLVMLQQRGDKLAHKLQQRIARDKAMSRPPKPVRTRSNLSLIPRQPNVYKSVFYKAVAKDYSDTKKQQQAPVVKKQHQPTPLLKPKAAKGHDPTTGAAPVHVANKKDSKCPVKGGAVEEDKETDPSNSWALTTLPPVPIAKITIDTKAPYPDLTPLDSIVSLYRQNEVEETEKRLHLKRMRQLAYAHRQLVHMYELSRIHEHMFAASNFVAIEDEEISSDESPTPAASRPLSVKSNEKLPALELVSCSSASQPPTPPLSALKSSAGQFLPKISPAPFLSLDEAIKNSTNIKESKKMSSLWKNYTRNIK